MEKLVRETGLKRQRNQRGEGARLRDEVMEAAMRVLDRAPGAELTLRTVAREAGVAAPSLYRQFADADTMTKEVIQRCWEQMGDVMFAAGARLGNVSPVVQLQAQMAAYVRYAMQTPSRYQLLFALPINRETELAGPLRPAFRVALETIEKHAAAKRHLPTEDAVSSTILTISLAHGRIALAHLSPVRRGNQPAEVEAFVAQMVARLFTG